MLFNVQKHCLTVTKTGCFLRHHSHCPKPGGAWTPSATFTTTMLWIVASQHLSIMKGVLSPLTSLIVPWPSPVLSMP